MVKKNVGLLLFAIIAVFLISVSGCKKDKITPPDPPVDNGNDSAAISAEIDQFIWYNMNLYYLWYKNVPDLADTRFATTTALNTFLNTFNGDHNALFDALLYQKGTIDKWSWIVDDYVALENSFQGITKSTGMEYVLYKYSNSDGVYGIVEYVIPGSPADLAGIKRGDVFIKIDSQNLDINNYRDLLSNRDAFTISFADIINNTVTPNGKTFSLITEEVHENPILYTKVIESQGRKIGYMVYNGFMSNYDAALNDTIGKFKNEGIQDLILDLRYNGGGSINTAAYLSSMIYGPHTNQIFCTDQYNDKLNSYFQSNYGSEYFNLRFSDTVPGPNNTAIPINSLGLSRVYVISTPGTASASELVINGLKPYINVILVGEHTHGKYVGSFTIKDYDNNGNVNPDHTWALQPITLKIANSQGVSDYVNGFTPDYAAEENIANLLPFGDENEPMLKAALDAINGIPQTKSYKLNLFERIGDSKDLRPHAKEMFLEGDIFHSQRIRKN